MVLLSSLRLLPTPLLRSPRLCLPILSTLSSTAENHQSLKNQDTEVYDIIQREQDRQFKSVTLIPSENFTSRAVRECTGSILTNKYCEGLPGSRYYGGNEHIDTLELLCQQRALEVYGLDKDEWGVNVQALSGSPANFAVYTALLAPFDRIMGLDLPHGGHLSHGFQTATKKVSATSKYFTTFPYRLDLTSGRINYEELETAAMAFRPKIIIAGITAYSRHLEYNRFRQIADLCGAVLMADMAHVSGLVAGGVAPSPFEFCDVVTSTTHKTLRGPRGAMIFYRKNTEAAKKAARLTGVSSLEDAINAAVFPGLQGGPHAHSFGALAVALRLAHTTEFREYQKRVVENAAALASALLQKGYTIVSGGTDNHMMIVDLKNKKLSGAKAEKICEKVNISLNKNTIPTDTSAFNPSGIRLGTPAMTTRGFTPEDFVKVAKLLDRSLTLGADIQAHTGKKLTDFVRALEQNKFAPLLQEIQSEVEGLATKFPLFE